MSPFPLIDLFYPHDTRLKQLLLRHSAQVRDKALVILDRAPAGAPEVDREAAATAAMLHDIGIFRCHAPSIGCTGPEPYLAHGAIGALLLRTVARETGRDLEIYARVCERHTGAGITAEDVRAQNLPLPLEDFVPETPLEKLICLADKFFSKSGDLREKPFAAAQRSVAKFGPASAARFQEMCTLFGVFA